MSQSNQITLVIPTHNRPEFLARSLHYYREVGLEKLLVVVDSSDEERQAGNLAAIKSCRELPIRYLHYDLGFMEKCTKALQQVATPYLVFSGDDDFHLLGVIDQCVSFLNGAPDYTTAQGRVMTVSNARTRSESQYTCRLTDSINIADSSIEGRYTALASHTYSTFYAVHRTEQVCHAFQRTTEATDYQRGRAFTESMLLAFSVIAGKVKVFPEVQFVQQCHGQNESRVLPRLADKGGRDEMFARYRAEIVAELARGGGIEAEDAERVFDENLGLLPMFRKELKRKRIPVTKKLVRELSRPIEKIARRMEKAWNRSQSDEEATAQVFGIDHLGVGREARLIQNLLVDHPLGLAVGDLVRKSA